MENITFQGEIEVILEDKNGNIKHREVKKNTVTDGYLRYMFYDSLNHGNLSTILRSNIRTNFNLLERTVPNAFGIYALNDTVDIKSDTYIPPYVDLSMKSLKNVTFYNSSGTLSETNSVMIPADSRCYFDYKKKEFSVEYVKNTFSGTIKSICVGRTYGTQNTFYSTVLRDQYVASDWFTATNPTTSNYILEHKNDETIIYKTSTDLSRQMSFNTKTKEFLYYANPIMSTNITSQFGALIVGNNIFKISKLSSIGNTHIARLSYIKDWNNNSVVYTKDIEFIVRDGSILSTTTTPVLVTRFDENKLEIFLTTSTGLHDNAYGCNIQKAIIDLSDIEDLSYEIEDLGVFDYGVSNYTTSTINTYQTGLYYNEKYYLPIYYTQNSEVLNVVATATYQDGIVTSDFINISNFVNFRQSASSLQANVITENDVNMCRVNSLGTPYVYMSHIISGVNLNFPVTKTEQDILRIIYRYKLV